MWTNTLITPSKQLMHITFIAHSSDGQGYGSGLRVDALVKRPFLRFPTYNLGTWFSYLESKVYCVVLRLSPTQNKGMVTVLFILGRIQYVPVHRGRSRTENHLSRHIPSTHNTKHFSIIFSTMVESEVLSPDTYSFRLANKSPRNEKVPPRTKPTIERMPH